MKRNAFTLSEVLLVLSVIGVIAAITIPTLVQRIDDSQNISKLKKVYSVLTQATTMILANDIIWDSSSSDNTYTSPNNANMFNLFTKYIQFVKTDQAKNIFTQSYAFYKNTNARTWDYIGDTRPAAITADGTSLLFSSYQNCTASSGSLINNICGFIYVDTNGSNAPNMWGKDLFQFWILKDTTGSIYTAPLGVSADSRTCSVNSVTVTTSQGCTAIALTGQTMP